MERKKFFSNSCSENFEGYDEFLNRIFSFQKPQFTFGVNKFFPSESVKNKVEETGEFKRFLGDTVVFDLLDSQKKFIHEYYIEPLYSVANECFAKKLEEHTFHMTLHDLNASNKEDEKILKSMFDTELSLAKIVNQIDIPHEKIEMTTTCVFNMVNTSLVLGLKPKTQKDYEKLMLLYCLVESVYQLPYPFTPHITLAYYNRDGFEGEQLIKLEKLVNELNSKNFDFILSTDKLYYQKFVNMNEYFNVMKICRGKIE